MRAVHRCAECGHDHWDVSVEIDPTERDAFLAFVANVQQSLQKKNPTEAEALFIPPAKYPKQPLVIVGPAEDPCQHCKIAELYVGPTQGCPKIDGCLAFMYYQWTQIDGRTIQSQRELPMSQT